MYFAVLKRFDTCNGERWRGYTRWLGRTDLQRVITLDSMLCPTVVHPEDSDDWQYVAPEEFMLDYFTDLDFVLQRASKVRRAQVVAVMREPEEEGAVDLSQPGFEFAGYDLMDLEFTASALLGSDRFAGVFEVSELSAESGLIPSCRRAGQIRDKLRRRYPDRKQANCNVWAIWRYTGGE